MKVRIYYNGYKDKYFPQYRWIGIWITFREFDEWFGSKECFSTKDDAIGYLHAVKVDRRAEREREATAKERSKKSGVVYEDVI